MAAFTAVWEFRVAPAEVEVFRRVYGPEGEWVQLFRRAPGYVRSVLLRDPSDPLRFLTLDEWESGDDWKHFKQTHAHEYRALDERCARLTTEEKEIGRFVAG